ncbi:hypothetical protein, partial [Candidatus Chloroploca sp. Khr17]|uniref:hypothetical protein n=1 Tax=Candidatus Chloroploca sp. Khr17 TaxID=2496869 RepID=UPI0013EB4F47
GQAAHLGEVAELFQAALTTLLLLGLFARAGDQLGEARMAVGHIGDQEAGPTARWAHAGRRRWRLQRLQRQGGRVAAGSQLEALPGRGVG